MHKKRWYTYQYKLQYSKFYTNVIIIRIILFSLIILFLFVLNLLKKDSITVVEESSSSMTYECCQPIPDSFLMEYEKKILAIQRQNFKDRMAIDPINERCLKDEIFSLAKIISAEAGNVDSVYYSEQIKKAGITSDIWQQMVGYVVMNRVHQSDQFFPNTIEKVFYQGNAYAETSRERYENNFCTESALKNAKIVIEHYYTGTVPYPRNMVYQAEFQQKETYLNVGNTYFCLDPNLPAD